MEGMNEYDCNTCLYGKWYEELYPCDMCDDGDMYEPEESEKEEEDGRNHA